MNVKKIDQIEYEDLNARQQENYNYHKVSSRLADFGFTTIRLNDDWKGADFIAQHAKRDVFLKVQLKGRLTFVREYVDKGLHVAFPHFSEWYLYRHDDLLDSIYEETGTIKETSSWMDNGKYHRDSHSSEISSLLKPYKLSGEKLVISEKALGG